MFLTSESIRGLILDGVEMVRDDAGSIRVPLIEGCDPQQIEAMEGGVYDLRAGELSKLISDGSWSLIGVNERRTPKAQPMEPMKHELGEIPWWLIYPGATYLISTIEQVNVPAGLRGLVEKRTTTFRCGVELSSMLTGDTLRLPRITVSWVHPGYHGPLTFKMVNDGPGVLKLEHGARIASIAFARYESAEKQTYSGVWQGGRVSTQGETERGF